MNTLNEDNETKVSERRGYGTPPCGDSAYFQFQPGFEEFEIIIKPDHPYANPGRVRVLMLNTVDGATGWQYINGYNVYAMAPLEHSSGITGYKRDFETKDSEGADVYWFSSVKMSKRRSERLSIPHDKGLLVPIHMFTQ